MVCKLIISKILHRYNSLSYTFVLGTVHFHQLQALVKTTGSVQHLTTIYPKGRQRKLNLTVFFFIFHFLCNYPILYDCWLLWNWEYQPDSHPLRLWVLCYLFFSYFLIWSQLHGSLHAVCYEYLFLLTSASIPVGITKECLQSRGYSENNDSFNFWLF